jgi:dTDP-4-dehydrorhamnose reductase
MADIAHGRDARRVLVLGGSGMLGSTVVRELLSATDVDVRASVRRPESLPPDLREALGPRLVSLDALDDAARRELLEEVRPDAVLNAVGVIKQAGELTDHVTTVAANALLPHQLARDCDRVGARLVQASTDCVFSGRRGGYRETDTPDPVDFYGRSKLLGEVDEPHLTLRTSIIGPELTRHASLLDWFLSQSGHEIKGYAGAIFSGVTTVEFARFLRTVVLGRPDLGGVLHLASRPISKYDLLHLVADAYGWTGTIARDVDFRCDRSLSGDLLAERTGYRPPSWPDMIRSMWQAHQDWSVAARTSS